MTARIVLIASSSQESLLRAAFLGAGFAVRTPTADETTLQAWIGLARPGDAALFVIDPQRLRANNTRLVAATAAIQRRLPDAAVAATLGERVRPLDLTQQWAVRHGLVGAFGRVRKTNLPQTAAPLLNAASQRIGSTWHPERVQQFARAMLTVENDPPMAAHGVSDDAVDAMADSLLEECMALADRRWRLKVYPSCFVGIDAVSQLARKLGVDRVLATAFGQRLLERGYIYHVTGEQPFRDGNFYYRVHRSTERLQRIEVDEAELQLRQRVEVADRTWRGLSFPQCFIGGAACQSLMRAMGLDLAESVTLGQVLLETHAFRHVADTHDFFDTDYFYRFQP